MKMKKMIAVVFTAALVAAGTGITGLAADPFSAEMVFDTSEVDDAADDTAMISLLSETGNESDSNAEIVPAKPDDVVFSETLGLDAGMKKAFGELLNSSAYKSYLKNTAKTVVRQYQDKISGLFKGADKIEVSIEVKLTKVALEDDGKIQYVRYSAAPKACGFKDGSSLGTKKLDGGGYKLGDGAKLPVPIPEKYIADNVKEGVYMIHDNFLPRYVSPSPYPKAPGGNWFYAFRDDFGGYGEVVIVPSRWQVFDDEYYHKESDVSFWVGTDSLVKGTSVTVHFIDCTFDEIENPAKEYIDCKMSTDGGSVIITGKKAIGDGPYELIYMVRKLKDGLELKMPFNVNVIDASQSSGSSSSSDEGGSYSAPSTEPEPSGGWEAGEKGWWYRFKDGTYPSNGWKMLEWRGKTSWYYFGADGYMVSGWITDTDGNRYFLHDKLDGTQGYMYTGWHEIDGKWYYFSEAEGGPLGSLLVDTTTPDGYQVGADGAWIQ